ncbi:MAG: helix-turn-helix domain-containing protein [Bacteroidales bacterium]|nr:helix-turn-helix domain-containing protein [Bacteroidales bacterium]
MARPVYTEECLESFCGNVSTCQLTREDIDLLNQHRVEVKFKKGEIICKQGSFANHLIYIKDGLSKSYLEDDNKVQIICINPGNCILGIQSLTTQGVFHYSVAALEDVYACLFDMDVVKTITKRNAGFAYALLTRANEAQVLTYDRFFSLTMKQLHGRMADILICLTDRVYKSDSFTVDLSRKDLAELTAMSNESATRVLKDFKDDKIIVLDGKSITILDRKKLQQVSKFG